jgi:hypothetical protein
MHLNIYERYIMKPRFLICFRYTNHPKIRPNKPYLVPLNEAAKEFRWINYGTNGILFNSNCK